MRRISWIVAAALFSLAACGSMTSYGDGGGGGGGGSGGGVGGGPVGQVRVGNTYFKSAHNGTRNTAVDTIAAGGSVTWISVPDIFRNSVVMSAKNNSYTVTLNNPGTYPYQCAVHGAAMTGVIVVQ